MDGSGHGKGGGSNAISAVLQSGSPRVLNCFHIAEALKAAGTPEKVLFKTSALNRGVLFKDIHAPGAGQGDKRVRVGTKVYIPFDGAHPEEGGMTVFYSRYTFMNSMRELIDVADATRKAELTTDMAVLDQLDTLPTFAPFLVKDSFERAGITADPAYCTIPEDEWKAIQVHVRASFGQIMTAVAGGKSGPQDSLDKLIDKLWDLKDMPALRSLAVAFGLDPDNCLETFYSWKGVLYFVWAFSEIRSSIYALLAWLDDWANLLVVLPPNKRAEPKLAFAAARAGVATMLNQVESTLTEYQHGFQELFVSGLGPQRFIRFLGHANDHFVTCGAGLGLLQHAHEQWERSTRRFPERRPNPDVLVSTVEAVRDIVVITK